MTKQKKAQKPVKRQQPTRRKSRTSERVVVSAVVFVAALVVAMGFFVYQAQELSFTQDDAYISYRYAQNAIDGHGLVFNEGERVEGYTNFFWVILLIAGRSLGFEFDTISKTLGVGAALALILLTGLWIRAMWRRLGWGNGDYPAAGAVLLLAANGSMVYWAVSGLETLWFTLFITLGVWAWIRRSWLVAPALAVASLTRPEGVFIWGLLVLAEAFIGDGWKRAATLAGTAVLLLAPFAVFKVAYYGSLFPNPFYAKTGFSLEYLLSGLDYTWTYMFQFAGYGVVVLLVIAGAFVLPGRWRAIPLIWLAYAIYITVIGGDVLKVHRFYVPITAFLVVSVAATLYWLIRRFQPRVASPAAMALLLILGVSWYFVPKESVEYFRGMERGLIEKMTVIAEKLKRYDDSDFSLAVSTIGKISYDLMGHRVIDMLGLTDSTIARHPEHIAGNVSSWRERKFNSTYLLEQEPTYILFSTGHKPSAPAERALILHKDFRRNYYTTIYPSDRIKRNLAVHVFKGGYTGPDSVWQDIEWVQDINQAWNLTIRQARDSAIAIMKEVKAEGPGDYAMPDYFIADQLYRLGEYYDALAYTDSALAIDSLAITAWQTRGMIHQMLRDTTALMIDVEYIQRYAPQLLE
ncbi:MAG: hypothetical protein GF341_04005 [candidate division Zixibacteria bacterium]|nr:hypothetical protein [candidate division Zixibacteria bacterium]